LLIWERYVKFNFGTAFHYNYMILKFIKILKIYMLLLIHAGWCGKYRCSNRNGREKKAGSRRSCYRQATEKIKFCLCAPSRERWTNSLWWRIFQRSKGKNSPHFYVSVSIKASKFRPLCTMTSWASISARECGCAPKFLVGLHLEVVTRWLLFQEAKVVSYGSLVVNLPARVNHNFTTTMIFGFITLVKKNGRKSSE